MQRKFIKVLGKPYSQSNKDWVASKECNYDWTAVQSFRDVSKQIALRQRYAFNRKKSIIRSLQHYRKIQRRWDRKDEAILWRQRKKMRILTIRDLAIKTQEWARYGAFASVKELSIQKLGSGWARNQ